jgi:menaquinol-cytochrome c reductase cytochrome b/c subunit
MMLLTLAAMIFLTWQSVVTHDWKKAAEQGKIRAQVEIDKNAEGYKIAQANTCTTCHGENLSGGAAAPSLVGTGLKPEEIAKIARHGRGNMPPGVFKGTDEELKKLTEFIAGLKAK